MLVAAAVCPHPPLLVPQVAAGAAPELDDLRQACDRALDALAAVDPEVLVVVGGGTRTRRHPPGSAGSLRRYGVDVEVSLGAAAPGGPGGPGSPAAPTLPLSLSIGAWLLTRSGLRAATVGWEVASDAPTDDCRALGERLAAEADRVALLVMGDGSARRSPQAPGYEDPRAAAYDAAVVQALADGDGEALLVLDPAESAELMAAGRAAWQVLAGAAADQLTDTAVLYDAAPYGVEYVVALWERHG